ncbi:MAG: competence/damage-inducible protein A [Nitrospiraceae bacterium]|nr:MAG: competence/damage-inducible protein A [Nitrospiraceae bacterium]
MKTSKTAGIIIIGNEILSGKVRDINSYFLATELRSLGVDVRRISVIPDEIETIGEEAAGFSRKYDYVFTSGGVGPTHDDVTMAGIAKGFGVQMVSHPDIVKVLLERYRKPATGPVLKMAEVPEGSEIISNSELKFPVVLFRNIYIFPGIPEYLQKKFSSIREWFRGPSIYLKKLYLNAHESEIAGNLNIVVEENPQVMFGSYPLTGTHEYRVLITVESRSEDVLNKAVDELTGSLPAGALVMVE